MPPLSNWAGNVAFRARTLHRPASVAELQQLVARSERIRSLGGGHSFSLIADTAGELVSVAGLPPLADVDAATAQVHVSAGLRYSDLAPRLDGAGFALANLASLPHITVGGAVATGTHGSGAGNRCLSAAVSALDLVGADGALRTVSRETDPGQFAGLVVALGAAGIVTGLTLDLVPAFAVRQWVCAGVPFTALLAHLDEVTAAAYSVSVFTPWGPDRTVQVWLKSTEPAMRPPDDWLGGRLLAADVHPVPGMPAEYVTAQAGLPGPWHERLPHFRPDFTPSAGDELQSEFLLAREHGPAALAALDELGPLIAPVLLISEIRTVAADDLWLSPAYQRDTLALHFTWKADARAVAPVLAAVEAALEPLAPRPHWGKVSTIPAAEVAGRYPRINDMRALVAELDPDGTFRNEFTDAYLRPGA
jgi:alditol oxidase